MKEVSNFTTKVSSAELMFIWISDQNKSNKAQFVTECMNKIQVKHAEL